MKLAAAGLRPTSPVTLDPVTLEIPVFARIAYPPAAPGAGDPSATGAGPAPAGFRGLLLASVPQAAAAKRSDAASRIAFAAIEPISCVDMSGLQGKSSDAAS